MKGSIHDKKLYDQTRLFSERKIKKRGDLEYVGTGMLIPFKKPKNGALTDEQKRYNKRFSKIRIIVEHVIAHMKKFRILTYRFRNSINTYNIIFKNVAGLRNFVMAS